MHTFLTIYLPIIVTAILAFVFGHITHRITTKDSTREQERIDIASATEKRNDRIAALESKQAAMEAEAKPMFATVLAMSIAKLTHFHTPVTDKILEKIVPPFEQTEEEIEELAKAMKERMKDVSGNVDEAEKIHAKILPDLIRLAKIEAQEENNTKTEIQMIKVLLNEISKE